MENLSKITTHVLEERFGSDVYSAIEFINNEKNNFSLFMDFKEFETTIRSALVVIEEKIEKDFFQKLYDEFKSQKHINDVKEWVEFFLKDATLKTNNYSLISILCKQEEIFLPIPGYESLYEVSQFGNVRSLIRNIILKPADKNTYPRVVFSKQNIQKTFCVSQLVFKTFLSKKYDYNRIYYLDKNSSNIRLDNLCIKNISEKERIKIRESFKLFNGSIRDFAKTIPGWNYQRIRKVLNEENIEPNVDNDGVRWKSLPCLIFSKNSFLISEKGQLKSTRNGLIMNPHNNGRSMIFYIMENYKKNYFSANLLVAEAFIDGYNKKIHDVIHKDGDYTNNTIENLELQLKRERAKNFKRKVAYCE